MPDPASPQDDAPPTQPRGRRTPEQIAAAGAHLVGAAACIPFVAGLIESGEWELHDKALRKALADAWGLADRTVRDYATRARFAALASPEAREAIAARIFTGFEIAEEHAYGDESKAAGARTAIAALVEQRTMLGLTSPVGPALAPGAGAGDPAVVPLAGIVCGACDRATYADPLPAFCGHCAGPLEAPAPDEGDDPDEGGEA